MLLPTSSDSFLREKWVSDIVWIASFSYYMAWNWNTRSFLFLAISLFRSFS